MIFSNIVNQSKSSHTNENIVGFMHIGVLGDYKRILEDQLNTLKETSLLSATSVVFAGISGQKIDLPKELQLAVHNPVLEDGEVETIRYIHNMRKQLVNCKVWYIHTKGAKWNPGDYNVAYAESWRKYMEHFVLYKWRDCAKALDEYDICGVEWDYVKMNGVQVSQPDNDAMGRFSGNFWWANGNYLAQINQPFPIVNPYGANRHQAEFYLGRRNPKVLDFASGMPVRRHRGQLYTKNIKRSEYINIKML